MSCSELPDCWCQCDTWWIGRPMMGNMKELKWSYRHWEVWNILSTHSLSCQWYAFFVTIGRSELLQHWLISLDVVSVFPNYILNLHYGILSSLGSCKVKLLALLILNNYCSYVLLLLLVVYVSKITTITALQYFVTLVDIREQKTKM